MKKIFFLIGLHALTISLNAQNSKDQLSLQGDFESFSSGAGATINTSSIPTFSHTEATVGTRFLFKNWVKGKLVNNAGQTFAEGLFNFEKIPQVLYVKTNSTNKVYVFQKTELKSLMFTDGDIVYQFEKIPSLNNSSLYRKLAGGSKYSLYSLMRTSFQKANFTTNGIITTGNPYDEYRDEITYFVVFADGKAKEVSLKKKAIKKFFEADKNKVDKYFSENDDTTIDEKFLIQLIDSLNL